MERFFYFVCTIGAFYLIFLSLGWSFSQRRWIYEKPFSSAAIAMVLVFLSWVYSHLSFDMKFTIFAFVFFPLLIFYLVRLSRTAK